MARQVDPVSPSVRLYGHKYGTGSFRVVTDGIEQGIQEFLQGVYPIDIDEDLVEGERPDGEQAPIAIHVGFPSAIAKAIQRGRHQERWLMLAPNSDRIPPALAQWLAEGKAATSVLTPSEWGKDVIEQQLSEIKPRQDPSDPPLVYVVPHGIDPEVFNDGPSGLTSDWRDELHQEYAQGTFKVLHITSTNGQRKGTRELIEAFDVLHEIPGLNPSLLIVAEPAGYLEASQWVHGRDDISVVANMQLRPQVLANRLYKCAHLIAQPSRAEGFGLVPLEAAACGIPTLLSDCGGHCQYLDAIHWVNGGGAEVVQLGKHAPMDDDLPGAEAPALDASALARGLRRVAEWWPEYFELAGRRAETIQQAYSWRAASAPLRTMILGRQR